ncbi:deoxyhypusine hydroxylase [Acrasis kona]|uniref:Deoxyhypusine hydroxylase n=1 Tax=Acrasis kona TaxID=1008807 RepID=A0AAW2Z9R2_9EUKA
MGEEGPEVTNEFDGMSNEELSKMLADENVSIAKRSRMLWVLREFTDKKAAIDILKSGLVSESALLKHELCYVMGQIADEYALPILTHVLDDVNEDSMVRHEAGEALGAISQEDALPILRKYLNDPVREVRETCELAVKNIEDRLKGHVETDPDVIAEFQSIDPAPAPRNYKQMTTQELKVIYLDESKSLYERYKAMFGLRNRSSVLNDREATMAICDGFFTQDGALFKHEVAFVLGQLQKQETADILEKVLRDPEMHCMVRHEAAEALGSISNTRSMALLEEFKNDPDQVVKDSCIVAIDMHNYWSNFVHREEETIKD